MNSSVKNIESLDAEVSVMYLVQLLLALCNNSGMRFEEARFTQVRNELVNRFGGITAVQGLWNEREQIVQDDLIIYEIMIEDLSAQWWSDYRKILEDRFQQQSLIVRANPIQLL